MAKLRQIIDFVLYLLSAWKQVFGGKKSIPSQADQTTAEQVDREAWEAGKRKYEESMKKPDTEFWKGEG